MHHSPSRASRALSAAGVALLLSIMLCACSVSSAARTATITPIPTNTPTPTPGVTFVVAVTSGPTPLPTRTPAPRPRPPTSTPAGPFVSLAPSAGPPVARTIQVWGANLPPSETVQLVWSPEGHFSPVQTTAYTGSHGHLVARFHVPGSPPGMYQVMVQINGVTEASARYKVTSFANLSVSVTGTAQGESVQITGERFLGNLHLVLVAYSLSGRAKIVVLGSVSTNAHGAFTLRRTMRKLAAGQYVLRAFSMDAVSAQMAEQFFEVVS